MEIRLAQFTDLEDILKIKAIAYNFMLSKDNKNQWIDDYPQKELLLNDIKNKHLYLITKNNLPHAFFYFNIEEDPTYINIYEGKWLNNEPYGVIHRLASDLVIKDVFKIALEFALKNINNLFTIILFCDIVLFAGVIGRKACGKINLSRNFMILPDVEIY